MSSSLDKPTNIIRQQNRFGLREVGLTHPDNNAYFKIADNGDVTLYASDSVAIVMSAVRNTITLVADKILFQTKETNDSLKWNRLSFNPKATTYTEPAFLNSPETAGGLFDGVDHYLGD